MNHEDFLYQLANPAPRSVLKLHPRGNIVQAWANNASLYAQAFGHHDDVHRFTAGHTGLDITGEHRAPIVAAHNGIVKETRSERAGLGGLCVWINSPVLDLNGASSMITTGYGHLDEIIVKPGQRVLKGETIGYMGNTGFIISGGTPYWGNAPAGRGTHLHFTLYEYIMEKGAFRPRFNNLMQNSSDPLPYLTGDTTGLKTALNNILAFIASRRKLS